jgi:TonB family protein
MDRLQKKCLIASTGVHLLLVLILLIGPGFLSAPPKLDDPATIIEFIPSKLIDGISGGGSPNAGQMAPPAAPPRNDPVPEPPAPRPPEPAPETKPDPEPAKPPVKPDQPDPDVLPDPSKTIRKKPEVNLKEIVRKPGKKAPTKNPSDDSAKKEDERLAGVRHDLASQLRGAAGTIGNRLTPGINIEPGDYGPGGGGPAAMNYAAYVIKVYEQAWIPPDDTDRDDAITKVTVTVARDGSVTLARTRIIRPSGDGRVDASVRRTLDRVKFIAPFPEGARDKERTYIINFNLRAKRATG